MVNFSLPMDQCDMNGYVIFCEEYFKDRCDRDGCDTKLCNSCLISNHCIVCDSTYCGACRTCFKCESWTCFYCEECVHLCDKCGMVKKYKCSGGEECECDDDHMDVTQMLV